eukprot:SAG22_NODE_1341_length_4687_cov_1.078030_2_plen_259_part_00
MLEVGSEVALVLCPIPPPAGGSTPPLTTYGLPFESGQQDFLKDKKGEEWIKVSMKEPPADSAEGSRPLQGFVPLAAVQCPGLLLNYDYLAAKLLGCDSEQAYPGDPTARQICDELLAQRFLTRVSRVAYPLLQTNENTEALRSGLQRAFFGTPQRRGQPDRTGVECTLRMLEKYLSTGTQFACGDAPCIADLSVVPPLLLLNVVGGAELLSPEVQKYVQNFEEYFGSDYLQMKGPVESWVESHKARVAELGITLRPSA